MGWAWAHSMPTTQGGGMGWAWLTSGLPLEVEGWGGHGFTPDLPQELEGWGWKENTSRPSSGDGGLGVEETYTVIRR